MTELSIKNLTISGIYCEIYNLEFLFEDAQIENGIFVRDIMIKLAQSDFRFNLELEAGDHRDQNVTKMEWFVATDQAFFDAFHVPEGSYSIESGIRNGLAHHFKYQVYDEQMRLIPNNSLETPCGSPNSPKIRDGYSIHWDVATFATVGVALTY